MHRFVPNPISTLIPGLLAMLCSCQEGASKQDEDEDIEPNDGIVLVYPFLEQHTITQTPADHTYTSHENWDIDCVKGESVLSPVAGKVVKVALSDTGYGNSVGIEVLGWGTIHLNHFDTVAVEEGCWVQPSDIIATCGTSGKVIPIGGGDGSHLDVYAVGAQGENLDLPSPDTWLAAAQSATPTCQPPMCDSQVTPQHPGSTYDAPYDCPGGVVMPISGSIDAESGALTVYTEGKGEYGPGTYRVLVFDPDALESEQCKPINDVKATVMLDSPASSIAFPSFPSLLTCGGAKAYCIAKEDGDSIAHFCSGRLVAESQ